MPRIEHYTPGSFCWVENVTDDAEAAKGFYRQVMGWHVPDRPGFAMLSIERDPVGALYALPASAWEGSAQPHWLVYVAVTDAAAAAARARELGGEVVREPFDTGGGWSSWLRDPEGAMFAVWQAGAHPGARRQGEPGTLCWPELGSADPAAAAAFYGGLFGWRPRDSGDPSEPYLELDLGGTPIGGVRRVREGAEPGWLPFFQVDDCDAVTARASEAGGRTLEPPADHPGIGRMAVLADPRGADFAVIRFGSTGAGAALFEPV